MSGRSGKVALIGLPLVAAAVVLIALNADPRDPDPKGTYALIFAVAGAYVFCVLAVQRLDIAARSRAAARPSIAAGTPLDDPMSATAVDLWASLATGPISDEAAEAHDLAWGLARRSNSVGWIICALIFTGVPLTYLTGSFVPLFVCAALVVVAAVVYLAGVLGGAGRSGGLGDAYEAIGRSVEPLGLELSERPRVGVGTRPVPPYGLKSEIHGALRFDGRRNGRRVAVTLDDGSCEVRVEAAGVPAFEAKARDGKVRGKRRGELPAEIELALGAVPGSPAWRGAAASGDDGAVVVRQKPVPAQGWMPSLWLAERIAAAAQPSKTSS